MRVTEIFYSIQGEGPFMGMPAIFIRLHGCNLRCSWCDSKYTWNDSEDYKEMSEKQILKKIQKYRTKHIIITGGEPLIQEIYPLVRDLKRADYKIHIETNGTIYKPFLRQLDCVVVSPKPPSANVKATFKIKEFKRLKNAYFKVVIKNESDWKWAKKLSKQINPKILYLIPEGGVDFSFLSKKIKKLDDNMRIGIQLHKIIWGDKRGV
ncbi:MAG: 7-carboxy-7-deazaguanine synthase QueE [Candidatus Diapherotrites archaeon]|nr:7-carboxy-7-deazaguanine synthase QueE [Candidatus Diapherotrites archaeon]